MLELNSNIVNFSNCLIKLNKLPVKLNGMV